VLVLLAFQGLGVTERDAIQGNILEGEVLQPQVTLHQQQP
jgi:hypothetical protein